MNTLDAIAALPDGAITSPAARRNADALLGVLRAHLPAKGSVLEIASGSGEHAVVFVGALPGLDWTPSDPSAEARANIRIQVGETVDGVVARLRRVVRDERVQLEVVSGNDPSPESPSDGPQFALLARAVEGHDGSASTLKGITSNVAITTNRDGREILLFPSPWSLDYAAQQNPGV